MAAAIILLLIPHGITGKEIEVIHNRLHPRGQLFIQ